ncbi:MAG: hypothetical protein LLF92_12490 [Planctomycetaceae bacterium]|nr:hypothetical protein [Planctomycetaceae bacterium]
MIWWIVIALILIIICGILFAVEFFIPSFGLIFMLAVCFLAGGISIFFKISTNAGWLGVVVSAILVPAVFFIFYKILPHTSAGKSLMLDAPKGKKTGEGIPDSEQLQHLLGQNATAASPLRPVGMCEFDGKRFECVAESGYVEKGKNVKVIKVEGTQLTVREV